MENVPQLCRSKCEDEAGLLPTPEHRGHLHMDDRSQGILKNRLAIRLLAGASGVNESTVHQFHHAIGPVQLQYTALWT